MMLSYVKLLTGFVNNVKICKVTAASRCKGYVFSLKAQFILSQESLKKCYDFIKKSVYYCVTQLLFKPLHLNRVKAVLIRKR